MSVNSKCNYSEKFRPLLTWITMTKSVEELEQFIQDHFVDDVNTILEKLGVPPSTPSSSKNALVIDRNLVVVEDSDEEAKLLSVLPGDQHDIVKKEIQTDLVRSLIYDPVSGTVVDLTASVQGHSGLNVKLFQYQARLLNDLRQYLGQDKVDLNVIPSDEDWNKLVVDTILDFENVVADTSAEYKAAKVQYAKLKYFDSFVKTTSPYIQIDSKYLHKPVIDKYTLQIRSRHYTGRNDFNHKFVESMKLASELATTLMNIIPEVTETGQDIVGSRVGQDEFFADAGKILDAIKYTDFEEFDEVRAYLTSTNIEDIDIAKIIDAYIKVAPKLTNEKQKIYNLNKLYGIKKHLFSPKFSIEIANLFKKYFLTNVPATYYAYVNGMDGFGATTLFQKMANSETGAFVDTVLAMADHWQGTDKTPFITTSKSNTSTGVFQFKNSGIEIQYAKKDDKYVFTLIKGDKAGIIQEIKNTLMYNFDSNFEHYFNSYYNTNKDDLFNEAWTNVLGLVALGSKNLLPTFPESNKINIRPYYPILKKIGDINALVLNLHSVSVVKNPEGNNLPTSTLPNLANKRWEQEQFIKKFEKSVFSDEEAAEFIKFIKQWGGNKHNRHIYTDNLIYSKKIQVGAPNIRSAVSINGQVKSPSQLTLSEILNLAIVEDFWKKLQNDKIEHVSLQHATFADKSQQFVIDYHITKELKDGKSLKDLLKAGNFKAIEQLIYEVRSKRYNQLKQNILNDYSLAFKHFFSSFDEIAERLKGMTLEKLQEKFSADGVNIVLQEQIHYIPGKDGLELNETILNYVDTFSSLEKTIARLNRERQQFLNNLKAENFTILASQVNLDDNTWVDDYGKLILEKDGKMNPVLETFFYADALLSNEYNNLLIGDIYSHPNKAKRGKNDSDEEYLLFSEASRLVAQIKRTVIPGATYQPFLMKKDGVGELINIAVIKDFSATVMNIMGVQSKKLDSMDGSGLASPYQVWLENRSLIDGKLNKDRKTIMHGLDPMYGKQMLLKWAVFELSNERRRLAYNSDISCELLFKKLHDKPITMGLNGVLETFIRNWAEITSGNPMYIIDAKSQYTYRLDNIRLVENENGETFIERVLQPIGKNNQPVGNAISHMLKVGTEVNSLYDLDQILGGAFGYTYNEELGQLIPSENNIEIVANTIVEHELKNQFIGYLVNKSAIKSGAGNINPSSSFKDDTPLMYLAMPSQFGGVQLDADHEIELAEVTEMTQLISALIQRGYTKDIVRKIYEDIGETIVESVADYQAALNSSDPNAVYRILGKALVESFAKGDKDSIGLAKTFVSIAQQFLNEENIQFKMPFSAATVYPQFLSVVTSNIVKSGIRRKYSGLISVLVPSHNMIQYYDINGQKHDYTELASIVAKKGIVGYVKTETGRKIVSEQEARELVAKRDPNYVSALESALHDEKVVIVGQPVPVDNPFVKQIDRHEVEFGDTIQIVNTTDGELLTIKVETFEDYDKLRNLSSEYLITKLTLAPKNLQASNLTFVVNGKTFSLYDLDIVRAVHYVSRVIENQKLSGQITPEMVIPFLTDEQKAVLYWVLNNNVPTAEGLGDLSFDAWLKLWIQPTIQRLKAGKLKEQTTFTEVVWDPINNVAYRKSNPEAVVPIQDVVIKEGVTIHRKATVDLAKLSIPVTNIKTRPAQLAIGKMYAAKFLLKTGDKLSHITGPEFFKQRLLEHYDTNKYQLSNYDYVFFDSDKNPIFVTIASESQFDQMYQNKYLNVDFKNVDGTVYYKNEEFLDSTDSISYWKVDSAAGPITMLRVDSVEDLKALHSNYNLSNARPNFTENNVSDLLNFIFRDKTTEEKVEKLTKYSNVSKETWTEELETPSPLLIRILNQYVQGQFKSNTNRLAEQMYQAWEIQKRLIGTRIPTQGMQSFMEMEIVMITDSEVNDVYVPAQQTFLQGSDYDIDKLFLLGWEIANNGTLITGSRLDKYYKPLNVLKLPSPKHRTFKWVENDEEADFIFTVHHFNVFNNRSEEEQIEVLREALLAGPNLKLDMDLSVLDENTVKQIQRIKTRFLNNLNLHDNTKLSKSMKGLVLKNKVIAGIHEAMSDPENIVNATAPIEMDEQQEAARTSTAGELVKRITSDNAFTKYLMQIQNMVGKEVIGISATGLKAYFALVNFYQSEFDSLIPDIMNQDANAVLSKFDKILFTDALLSNEDCTLVANLNFDKLISVVASDPKLQTLYLNNANYGWTKMLEAKGFLTDLTLEEQMVFPSDSNISKKLNLLGFLQYLNKRSNRMDAALTHSGFLSAATDNAKELILKKVNADAKFAGIYAYLISTGHTFTEIAELMKSPIFDEISRLSETNIFLDYTKSFSLKSALDWMANAKPIIVDSRTLNTFLSKITGEKQYLKYFKLEDALYERKDEIIKFLKEQVSNKKYNPRAGFDDVSLDFDEESMYNNSEPDFDDPDSWMDDPNAQEDVILTEDVYKNILIYMDFLDRKKTFMKNAPKAWTKNLKLIRDMQPFTEEMKLLGKILKINQKIEGKSFDKYNYIRAIEKGVSKILSRKGGTFQASFSLMSFLLDPAYRQNKIEDYEHLIKNKSAQLNILRLITESAHFGQMFKLIALDKRLLQGSAIKTRLTDKFVKEIERLAKNPNTTSVTADEYKRIENFVNDVLIYNYFVQREQPLIINISGKPIKLNSIFGIGEFMQYMNNVFIPELQKSYPDNAFAQTLTKGRRLNILTKEPEYFWNLNINFNLKEKNEAIEAKFLKVKADFLKISNNSINDKNPDWTIGDMLFLYNLFVNKDSFGKNSFSSIFQDIVVDQISPLINDFYYTLSQWDAKGDANEFFYSSEDLKTRAKALLVSTYDSIKNIFNMPKMNPLNPVRSKKVKPTTPKYTNVNDSTFITNLVGYVNSILSPTKPFIHVINDEDAIAKTGSYKGYIENGEVYVNVQSPEHLLHELTHVALAILKYGTPDKYYALLNSVKESETYKVLDESGVYSHLRGADFLEEVLTTDLGMYLSGRFTKWADSHSSELDSIFMAQKTELLDVLFPGTDSDIQFIIEPMKAALRFVTEAPSEISELLQVDQKLLNLKTRLFKGYQSNKQQIKLKPNCK